MKEHGERLASRLWSSPQLVVNCLQVLSSAQRALLYDMFSSAHRRDPRVHWISSEPAETCRSPTAGIGQQCEFSSATNT